MRTHLGIDEDKWVHAIIGWSVALTALLLFGYIITGLAVLAVGVGIEVYQNKTGSGVCDWEDALATVLGGIGGILLHWVSGVV